MSGAECEDSLCVNACLADGLSLIAQVTFILSDVLSSFLK